MRHRNVSEGGSQAPTPGPRSTSSYVERPSHNSLSTHVRPVPADTFLCSPWTHLLQSKCLGVMDAFPYSFSRLFFPELSATHQLMLSRIQEGLVPYREDDPDHVGQLHRLWAAHHRIVFDQETPYACPHPHWQLMGFQSTNPVTDFRSAGLCGLQQLVFLAEEHPEQWSQFLTEDYLLGAVGMNLTGRLIAWLELYPRYDNGARNQLQIGSKTYSNAHVRQRLCQFIHDTSLAEEVRKLNEVFCFCMRLVHHRWMQSSKNLMEFNQMLQRVYVELERMIFMSSSLDELCSLA